MKKLALVFFILIKTTQSIADEGMWLPQLIQALNISDMNKNGFKLTATQIYDINKASMKDAVVLFGGGCTAEIISNKGLILTNHHCGFSNIAALSTVQNDYLKNGYWAMNNKEELMCKGLTVTFIKRIDDVTSKITSSLKPNFNENQIDSAIKSQIKLLETETKKSSGYDVFIRPFFYGNDYYMFTTETFKDVRLVGTPPESIGKFGDETDNWVWPRHNADFSMFRIYADKNNKPAEYSEENVPYTPKYSFPINLKGTKKGDFTMVYGFPGRTQEYLTSYAVELLMKQQDPVKVNLREKRLNIMERYMKNNDTIRLMYTAKYAGVANYYKKWSGEMLGLQKSNAVEKKKQFENDFLNSLNSNPANKEKYTKLFNEFKEVYLDYAPLSKQIDYFTECLWGIEAFKFAANTGLALQTELKKKEIGATNNFDALLKDTKKTIPFKNFRKEIDKELCVAMLEMYDKEIESALRPRLLDSLYNTYKNNYKAMADFLYNNTSFVDNDKALQMFNDYEKNSSLYQRDPLYLVAVDILKHYQKTVIPQISYYDIQINELQKEYVKGLKETMKNKRFYPDANGTLRVAYGKVSDYSPKDGLQNLHFTTIDGIVEKNKTGAEDFYVKPRLLELYAKKDFGNYADKDGKLHVAFIASNHTTGGNSGSPVLNANGELIGTNFDRNWEGTMSDIMYNPDFCRNIILDVRFTLWIVDKYAGAGYLLNEMKLIK
ncbi:MAG: S46 family peptidase [Bacteroidetes bacterium]|nr:S46 family peptidase [Bacteroidota bacterium]